MINHSIRIRSVNSLSTEDKWKESIYEECKSFSQTNRLLGGLKRNSRTGELFFPEEKNSLEDVSLFLRYSPRKATEGGHSLPLATSYLLSKNLQKLSRKQQMRTNVFVFLSEAYDKNSYKQLENWFINISNPYTNRTEIIRTRSGNQKSWEFVVNFIKKQNIDLNRILFLIEDDYIFESEMVGDTIQFFASHNPCFVHPTDYPDRYQMNINDDDGQITIVAGKTRLWRSITSTTVTYAYRFKTFLAFEDTLMQPKDDWKASHRIRQRAGNKVFFSAIPSHGAHSETLSWPNETDPTSKMKFSAYYQD